MESKNTVEEMIRDGLKSQFSDIIYGKIIALELSYISEIARLKAENDGAISLIGSFNRTNDKLIKIIKAQDRLLVAYRLGDNPPEWVFKILEKKDEILAAICLKKEKK